MTACAICGSDPCSDYLNDARGLHWDEHMGEPMYRVRAQVTEDGRPIYSTGQLITLHEAVLRGLPGAVDQVTKGGVPTMAPVNKPTRSAEDRDAPRGGDRDAA